MLVKSIAIRLKIREKTSNPFKVTCNEIIFKRGLTASVNDVSQNGFSQIKPWNKTMSTYKLLYGAICQNGLNHIKACYF
jgi:hypothetical protein